MRSAICWAHRRGQRRQREKADRQHPFGPRHPVVRRVASSPRDGRRTFAAPRLAFGRGLAITVEVDELAFEGGSALSLGSVLAHFFTRYVSINSFTETALRSLGRGESIAGCRSGARDRHSRTVRRLAESPHAFDFYQTLRRLECLFAANPRWGTPAGQPMKRSASDRSRN